MPETFVIADEHLKHYNAIFHCNREKWIIDNPEFDSAKPYHFKYNNPKAVNLKQHDEDLIKYWNSVVGKKDTVWVLGDLAWKDHTHYISALNGSKYLIRGNHDKMPVEAFKLFKKIDGVNHYHYTYPTKIHGREIMFSHCPYATWFSSHHGSWNIHGHCHGRFREQPYLLQFDAGTDVVGYRPLNWSIAELKIADKEKVYKEYWSMNEEDRLKNFPYQPSGEAEENVKIIRAKNMEYIKQVGVTYEF